MDLVVETGTFPRLGETQVGDSFATRAGGKGADRTGVAAARLGANVTMLAGVGARTYLAVSSREVFRRPTGWPRVGSTKRRARRPASRRSPSATPTTPWSILPGANARLSAADLDVAESAFADPDVVLAEDWR